MGILKDTKMEVTESTLEDPFEDLSAAWTQDLHCDARVLNPREKKAIALYVNHVIDLAFLNTFGVRSSVLKQGASSPTIGDNSCHENPRIKKFDRYEKGVGIFLNEKGKEVTVYNKRYRRRVQVPGSRFEMAKITFRSHKLKTGEREKSERDLETWQSTERDGDKGTGGGGGGGSAGVTFPVLTCPTLVPVLPDSFVTNQKRLNEWSNEVKDRRTRKPGNKYGVGMFAPKRTKMDDDDDNKALTFKRLKQYEVMAGTVGMATKLKTGDGDKVGEKKGSGQRKKENGLWLEVGTQTCVSTKQTVTPSTPTVSSIKADRMFDPGVIVKRPVQGYRVWTHRTGTRDSMKRPKPGKSPPVVVTFNKDTVNREKSSSGLPDARDVPLQSAHIRPSSASVAHLTALATSTSTTNTTTTTTAISPSSLVFHEPLQLLNQYGANSKQPNQIFLLMKAANKNGDIKDNREPVSLRTVSLPKKGRIKLTAMPYELDNPHYFDDRREAPRPPSRHYNMRWIKFQIIVPMVCLSD